MNKMKSSQFLEAHFFDNFSSGRIKIKAYKIEAVIIYKKMIDYKNKTFLSLFILPVLYYTLRYFEAYFLIKSIDRREGERERE